MLKKIWHWAGNIKISFVLLMSAALILFFGSMVGNQYFTLMRTLNRTRVQDWLAEHLAANPGVVWWIPVLFIVMGSLGLNTFICATDRVSNLLVKRRSFSKMRFFYLLVPSLIHYLFIFIMLGHLITFTTGKWETIPLETGARIDIGKDGGFFTVTSITDRYFMETSAMRNRIDQTRVTLTDDKNREILVQYLSPVFMNGHFLLLDKKKQTTPKAVTPITGKIKETCNQAHVFHQKVKKQSELRLLVVSDPGFAMIIIGLSAIMMLMIWYFIFPNSGQKKSKPLLRAFDSQADDLAAKLPD